MTHSLTCRSQTGFGLLAQSLAIVQCTMGSHFPVKQCAFVPQSVSNTQSTHPFKGSHFCPLHSVSPLQIGLSGGGTPPSAVGVFPGPSLLLSQPTTWSAAIAIPTTSAPHRERRHEALAMILPSRPSGGE